MWERKGEDYWKKKGNQRALLLFQKAAKHVPAYKHFLSKYGVNPQKVRTIKDFHNHVPIMDKQNYILQYSEKDRSWNGEIARHVLSSVSSGTSGLPTFWMRGGYQEYEAAVVHEILFSSLFSVEHVPTLCVVCFPMGIYVSGMATIFPLWVMKMKGYPFTLVPAGNKSDSALVALKRLWKEYQQIILVGHPLFVKRVLEEGKEEGIQWGKRKVGMFFCSEGYSEKWRSYVQRLAGQRGNRVSAFSVYGSSDLLLMGYETPYSVHVRKKLYSNASARKVLGIEDKDGIPLLFQYNPYIRYIESINKELVFTAFTGTPLIRYNMHDVGNVYSYREIEKVFLKNRSTSSLDEKKLPFIWKLPFVTLYGRTGYAVVFYGANIYYEQIRNALDRREYFSQFTGNFLLRTPYTKKMNKKLEIHIELKKGKSCPVSWKREVAEQIFSYLFHHNLEYKDVVSHHKKKDVYPRVQFWEHGSPPYFLSGSKPRFIEFLQ